MSSELPDYLGEGLRKIAETMGGFKVNTTMFLPGERRDVAVLFLDIKGFTAMAENFDFEVVHQLMNGVMQTLSTIVSNNGGYVDKLEGDQIMALFGAKQASDNDSVRAIDCALRMLDALDEVNGMLSSVGVETGARVGVSFGQVIVAPDASGHLTATGDVVNVASRLESKAQVGTVMVSDDVRKECGELFRWKDLGEISIRGRSRPVHAWRPEGPGNERIQRWERAARVFSTPLLGRASEMNLLRTVWSGTGHNGSGFRDGKVHTLLEIQGDAGIGKSRLIHEFLMELEATDHPPMVLRGHTSSSSQPPLWLWSTLLEDAMPGGSGIGDRRKGLESLLKDMAEEMDDEYAASELLESLPFLESLLPVESSSALLDGMDDESRRKEMMIALKKFLTASSSLRRTVVVLEDLHWMDSASADVLLFLLLGISAQSPILFVLVQRPTDMLKILDRIPASRSKRERLDLFPLEEADGRLLVRHLLDNSTDSKLEDLILSRSQGNPFFIEELVLYMIESGSLLETPDGWRLCGETDSIPIPSSITGIIRTRIDRLVKGLKQALLQSSVLGCEFSGDLFRRVGSILGEKPSSSKSLLMELCAHGFLRTTESPLGSSYTFPHVLIRNAAYDMLLLHNRVVLHRCAAQALEEDTASDRGAMAGVIADHWSNAGHEEKAIEWGRKALVHCRRNFLNDEGLAVAERLIRWIGRQPGSEFRENALFEVMLEKEQFLNLLTSREDQEALQNELLLMTGEPGREHWAAIVNERRGRMQIFRGKLDQAREILASVLEETLNLSDPDLHAKLLTDMAILCIKQGKPDKALSHATEALGIYRKTENRNSECMLLNTLGGAYWNLNRMEEALDHFRRTQELSRETRNRWFEGNALGNMGIIYRNMGDFMQARLHYNKALALHREIGNRLGEAHMLANLGVLELLEENLDKAQVNYEDALRIYRETDNSLMELQTLAKMGRLCSRAGRYVEAETYFRESLEMNEEIGQTQDEGETLNSLAELLIKTDRSEEASAHLDRALKINREVKNAYEELDSLFQMTSIALDQGRPERAAELYRTAVSVAADLRIDSNAELILKDLKSRLQD